MTRDANGWPLLLFHVEEGREKPYDATAYWWANYNGAGAFTDSWCISVDPRTGLAWTWCRD